MEDGSTQPQVLGAAVGNSCLESRGGRIASTRTCQISRLRAMACMAYTPRGLNPLRTRISLLLPESRTQRIRLVRDHFLPGFSSPLLPLHPYRANGLRVSTRTDRLRDLPHNGPTHHLRTSPTTPTIPTDHNPKYSTDHNPIPNNRTPTRPEVRLQEPDRSLSKAEPRALVLAGTSMSPASSNHVTSPPLLHTLSRPGPRTPLVVVFRTRICKMRLRSSGLNWNRSVGSKLPPLICVNNYPRLWRYIDEHPTRVDPEGF